MSSADFKSVDGCLAASMVGSTPIRSRQHSTLFLTSLAQANAPINHVAHMPDLYSAWAGSVIMSSEIESR